MVVEFAENGLEALKKHKDSPFDVILMDMQMPVMDGYAAVKEIRSWENSEHRQPARIVALTAHGMQDDREKCVAIGADDYVLKPVKKAEMLAVIQRKTVSAEARP